MPIKIQNEEGLVVRIAEAIGTGVVSYSRFVDFPQSKGLEQELDLPEDTIEKLHRHCGELGLYFLVRSEINQELLKLYTFNSKTDKKLLKQFKEFSDPIVVAKRIVATIKSLPQRYRATVQLPVHFSAPLMPFVNAVKITDNMAICRTEKLPDNFSCSSSNANIDDFLFSDLLSDESNTERALNPERLYLTSVELGYGSTSSSNLLASSFMDKIRAIYGASLAMGFFATDYSGGHEKRPFILVHSENSNREILATENLDTDLWEQRWTRSTNKFVDSATDPARAIRTIFEKISIIFGNDEFSRRLFTAFIWFYRAKISRNVLDSLLHSTIAIEVLLGERETSESVGLQRLLGNRSAYLLGRSRSARQSIIEEFFQIYKLRSAIVHGGRHKPERQDRKVADSCLRLCGNVIAKELELHHSADLDEVVAF